jgi:hypothetical protein
MPAISYITVIIVIIIIIVLIIVVINIYYKGMVYISCFVLAFNFHPAGTESD